MAPRIRALAESLDSILSPYMEAHRCPNSISRESYVLVSALGTRHACGAQTSNTHIHKII